MSPYRILAKNCTTGEKQILAAMLSIDKITKDRNIYIVDKVIPLGVTTMKDIVSIAHRMTGVLNSTVLAKYTMKLDENEHKYYLVEDVPEYNLYHLQSDCLKAAMEDYLIDNNLRCISVL